MTRLELRLELVVGVSWPSLGSLASLLRVFGCLGLPSDLCLELLDEVEEI